MTYATRHVVLAVITDVLAILAVTLFLTTLA